MKIITDKEKIEEIITRGVEKNYPSDDFLKSRLEKGEQLKIYLGIDPTGPTLHMGHMVVLKKLSQLQKIGHKIILLIGDFTAMIGDPDKASAREPLTRQQVMENQKLYKEQASVLLDFDGNNPAEFKYNSEWLGKMNFEDVLNLASKVTVQQILERDMLKKRFNEGKPIYVHEFMYPLMVAQDSLVMEVDGEVGGNDQTFNMLVGRDLQKKVQNKDKFVIPMKLLVDNSGAKMGKTTGNMLSFADSPDEKFGKIMS
jgi:tyrosyl-tRNA synthetase